MIRGKKDYIILTLNLKYATSQLNGEPDATNLCNFNTIKGDITVTCRFETGFYGLPDMHADFQKSTEYTLKQLKSNYYFLDDIPMANKRSDPDMHADFQKSTEYLLKQLKNNYYFFDDIPMANKRSEDGHKKYVWLPWLTKWVKT